MKTFYLLAALAVCFAATAEAQTAPTAASITVNDLRENVAPTEMVFSVTANAELNFGGADKTVTFVANKKILTDNGAWTNAQITTTGLSTSGAACTVTAASNTFSANAQNMVFTLADGGSTDCKIAAAGTATFKITTSIANNPAAGAVTATAVTEADTNTFDATVYSTATAAPFSVTNDVITLADKRVGETGLITVQFNAGALKTTDTIAIVLPGFSASGTVDDSSSSCGSPSFAKSSSGATFTVTATLGGDFNSAASGGALCELKFTGVTNPSSAAASPAYTILITDVAGKQVKTMTSAHPIATKTAAAVVNKCTAKTQASDWTDLGCTVTTPTADTVAGLGTVGAAANYASCTITCPTSGSAFVVASVKECNAKADAAAWASVGCVVNGTQNGTTVASLGTATPASGYKSCGITCPTAGGNFAVNAPENECTEKSSTWWTNNGCTVEHANGTTVSSLGTVTGASGYSSCTVTCPVNGSDFTVNAVENTCTARDTAGWAAVGCAVAGTATGTTVSALGAQSAVTGYKSCTITCPSSGSAFVVSASQNDCTARDAAGWAAVGCEVAGTATGTTIAALGAQSAATNWTSCAITCPVDSAAFVVNAVTACQAKADAAAWAAVGCVVAGAQNGTSVAALGAQSAATGYTSCDITCPVAGGPFDVNATAAATTTAAPATTTISGASAGAVWSAMVTVLALMGVSAML